MTQINPSLPIIGASVSTEEPKVKTALEQLVATINSLDNANISATAGISGTKLADTSIAAGKLASNSVETAKIVDDAVTAGKLKDSAATDADRAVTTDHIRDAAVTTAKVADSAVTTAKLASNAVTNAKIASPTTGTGTNPAGVTGTVTARKYADGLVLLEGSLSKTSGSWTSATVVTTLPSDFRPATAVQSIRPATTSDVSGFAFIYVSIATNGEVTIVVGSPFSTNITLANLGGITFQTA
jgi:hypothetical protein